MLFFIKSFVLKLIPTLIRRKLYEYFSRKKLNKIPNIHCDIRNLAALSDYNISDALNNNSLLLSWEEDKKIISNFNIPKMSGGINPGDQKAIYFLIKHFGFQKILEVGTHLGSSTVASALAIKSSDKSVLITVDLNDVNDEKTTPWKNYGAAFSPKKMIKKINLSDKVNFFVDSSISFMSKWDDKFDLIFLDGDHSSHNVYQEIPLALKLLKPNGIILLHDFFPEGKPIWKNKVPDKGPFLAIKRILSENRGINLLPLGELPWKTKLNTNKTSLAIISKK